MIGPLQSFALTACGDGAGPVAGACELPVFDPTVNDGRFGSTVVSGGSTTTLQGSATQITPGITGRVTTSLSDLFATGLTSDPRANPNDPSSLVVNTGNKTRVVIIPDPITGGTRAVSVFDNLNIADTHATSIAAPYQVDVNGPTNGRQYIDVRLGEVDVSGGTLNIAIGTLDAPTDSAENFINMGMAKQSSLFFADGTGLALSTLIWQGSNLVDMGSIAGAIDAAGPGLVESGRFNFHSYNGTFTSFDGSSHTVLSATDLQAYNNFLIARLQDGMLSPSRYDAEFQKAFVINSASIAYTNGPPLPDESYEPIGVRSVIEVNGTNAQGIVATGSRLDVYSVSSNGPVNSGGMLASGGGTVINNGQLSVRRSGGGMAGMILQTGGQGINNGVLNVGFLSGLTDAIDPVDPTISSTNSTGAYVNGVGSTFNNGADGIINVAGAGSNGIHLVFGGTGSSAGTINVGVDAILPDSAGASGRTSGALVLAGSHFINQAGGLIYLGRQPQYTGGAAVEDIFNNVTPLSGITVGGGATATNAGTITIGTLTQGSSGILAMGTGAVLNSGVININGAANQSPIENYGINVVNGSNVSNTGTINVNGINGIGIKLSGSSARAISSGIINVSGIISTAGFRNYGIWSEEAGAVATLSGAVNLTGDGAIGVHARSGGDVDIVGSGSVNFVSGSNQIGYYLSGAGSELHDNGTGSQDVRTTDSALFRIEDGAVFSGGSNASVYTASGLRSSTFVISGAGSTFDSGTIELNLTGDYATGVKIDGGATGVIANTATINLDSLGSVGGLVDGRKVQLDGSMVAATGVTELVNLGGLASSADNVVGFVSQYGGRLVNAGVIDLTGGADATGLVVRNGGVLDNRSNITVSNGTGILVEGADAASLMANTATIRVDDGVAGIHIRDGAFLSAANSQGDIIAGGVADGVLVGTGATGVVLGATGITVTGSGDGVENFAEIGNIGFNGTTIEVSGSSSGIRTATNVAANLADGSASSVTINVTGMGAGFDYRQLGGAAVPVMAHGNFVLGSGYTINNDAGAIGIRALTDGEVITQATVTGGASAGAALLAGTAAASTNLGTLGSDNLAGTVVDLSNGTGTTFTNAGVINAAAVTASAVQGSSGDDVINMAGGSVRGIIQSGDGTDIVNWTGGTLNGSIEMGAGNNDQLTLAGVDLSTTYHVDGGTGSGDMLTFAGIHHRGGSFAADDLSRGVNVGEGWETINFTDRTQFTLTDDLLLGGSTVNIDTTSTLYAGNDVLPVIRSVLPGDPAILNNGGTIDLTNGTSGIGDRLTVIGNYIGQNGRLILDTYLDTDGSLSDMLLIDGGTATGNTTIKVINAGGPGALTTTDGIQVVSAVNGATTAAGSFTLSGDYTTEDGQFAVIGGAYAYTLHHNGMTDPADGNWYLRSTLQRADDEDNGEGEGDGDGDGGEDLPGGPDGPRYSASVPVYEVYPQVLQALNGVATLQQRVGNRYWKEMSTPAERNAVYVDSNGNYTVDQNGIWGRIEGAHSRFRPDVTTSSTSYDVDLYRMQAGIDGLFHDSDAGRLIGGFNVQYAHAKADISSFFGDGEISTDGYGIGGTLTWYGNNGFYVDGQAQAIWYNSDLTSLANTITRPGLANSNNGFGYALSLESGKRIEFGNGWSVTPQAQLVYSSVDFDSFSDGYGTPVSLDRGNSLQGRLGVSLDKQASWTDDNGQITRSHLYGIANLYNEFLDGSRVNVAGVSFDSRNERLWGGLGLGGSYNWANDKYSFYGEGSVNTSLTSFADSYTVKGTVGFRVRF